jgi:GrpB-like predicted nucleotidyltransferase (UPF0157 family)
MNSDIEFEVWGLGLAVDVVRLVRVPASWAGVAAQLAASVAKVLHIDANLVEHIGSTAVAGLLAKPVIDLAAGLSGVPDAGRLMAFRTALERIGWTYRGDSGTHGGHVFLLQPRPGFRVAHLHLVLHEGDEWRRYIALRDVLRNDPAARAAYERTKAELVHRFNGDNTNQQYTDGKTAVIAALLDRA